MGSRCVEDIRDCRTRWLWDSKDRGWEVSWGEGCGAKAAYQSNECFVGSCIGYKSNFDGHFTTDAWTSHEYAEYCRE